MTKARGWTPYGEEELAAECPHARIHRCPLYVESHNARGLGCIDDLARPCRVKRGDQVYSEAIGRLMAVDLQLVMRCRFAEENDERREQRARNMRAAGLQ